MSALSEFNEYVARHAICSKQHVERVLCAGAHGGAESVRPHQLIVAAGHRWELEAAMYVQGILKELNHPHELAAVSAHLQRCLIMQASQGRNGPKETPVEYWHEIGKFEQEVTRLCRRDGFLPTPVAL